MAHRANYSFFALLLIFNILLVTTLQAVAARSIAKNSNNQDFEDAKFYWLKKHLGKKHIPGIGHIGFPPKFGLKPSPFVGGTGGSGVGSGSTGSGSGSGSTGRSYVPGGDDTFVPNPGFEVPIPGSGGAGGIVPPAVRP
ncbi:putative cell wall protein [Cicer arietinum]|uniref:Cell wall protein n=1 Tax=Cicer arietinum TaxID=3827 RepID=A0A1S2YLE4_CICAR|nr:putative cell wall protein [Cicer arietinum]